MRCEGKCLNCEACFQMVQMPKSLVWVSGEPRKQDFSYYSDFHHTLSGHDALRVVKNYCLSDIIAFSHHSTTSPSSFKKNIVEVDKRLAACRVQKKWTAAIFLNKVYQEFDAKIHLVFSVVKLVHRVEVFSWSPVVGGKIASSPSIRFHFVPFAVVPYNYAARTNSRDQ